MILLINEVVFKNKLEEMSQREESNLRPARYECAALPTELHWHTYTLSISIKRKRVVSPCLKR